MYWLHGRNPVENIIFDFKKSESPKNFVEMALEKKGNVYKPFFDFVTKNFSKDKTIKVLDIGCGDGISLYAIAYYLTEYKFEFVGYEPAAIRVENAKNLFNSEKLPNIEKALFYKGTFNENN